MTPRRTYIIRRWCVALATVFTIGTVMHLTDTGCAETFCEVQP